ncbi:MAG: S16 family serine protease, partial [Candidatus Micrarchaeota archaeon]
MNFKTLVLAFIAISLFTNIAFATTQVYAPAVDSNGKGVLTPIIVTVTPGTGRIRTDIQTSIIAPETEASIRTAAEAAGKEAGTSLNNVDVNVDIDSQAEVIDGPSGGMAFAIGIYNELVHLSNSNALTLRDDLVVTGAITADGRSEKVGGVDEKVIATNQSGVKLMLIAAGQSANDAMDYAVFAREISNGALQVVEVNSLHDSLKYVYTPNNGRVDAPQVIIQPLVIEEFQTSGKTEHVKQLALEEVQKARDELAKVTNKLIVDAAQNQNTGVIDGQTKAIIRSVNETLKNAEQAVKKGYYYTGANSAFLALINLKTVNADKVTSEDFQTMLNKIESEISQFNKSATVNNENFEDIAASRMRYWWALTRFEETKE